MVCIVPILRKIAIPRVNRNYFSPFSIMLAMSCQWAWVALSEDLALAAFFWMSLRVSMMRARPSVPSEVLAVTTLIASGVAFAQVTTSSLGGKITDEK